MTADGGPLIVVHGGVDMIIDHDADLAMRAAICSACDALDDPVASAASAVRILEQHPTFNAGLGSVLNADGDVEGDAAVVDGVTGRVGAIAAAPGVSSPVTAALELLRRGTAVFLAGDGARRFAESAGIDVVDLRTREQVELWEAFRRALAEGQPAQSIFTGRPIQRHPASTSETVGALVVNEGRIGAASSTGGLLGKHPGRVGDSCVLGAGILADERVGVLCSGSGEIMIELQLASRVAQRIHAGQSVHEAVRWAVDLGARERDATCAIVAVDASTAEIGAAHNGADFPVYRSTRSRIETVDADRVDAGASR